MRNLISLLKKSKKEFFEGYNKNKMFTEGILSEYGQYFYRNKKDILNFTISLKNSKSKSIGDRMYNLIHPFKTIEYCSFMMKYLETHEGII